MLSLLDVSLLKVALLLAHVVCTYNGMTPPNATTQTVPTNTRSSPATTALEVLGTCAALASKARSLSHGLFCGVALAEIAVLLAQHYPSAVSSAILAFLFNNNPPTASALSLTLASAAG
ncbi:hypothetical protein LXA43DRAFT_1070097, partial [Ganoderma leucocontextum]